MKLIIDIPDELFSIFKKHGIMAFDCLNEYDKDNLARIIANGTPYNPSGDCISREALKEVISKVVAEETKEDEKWAVGLRYALKLVDNAPPVEPERPKGEWIDGGVDISGHRLNRCSICNGVYQMPYVGDSLTRWNFCPNCNADMRGGAE